MFSEMFSIQKITVSQKGLQSERFTDSSLGSFSDTRTIKYGPLLQIATVYSSILLTGTAEIYIVTKSNMKKGSLASSLCQLLL